MYHVISDTNVNKCIVLNNNFIQFYSLVEANGLQIAAIGTSCLSVISSMPNIKSEALDENRVAVEAQMVLAKNSIAWAMKAISPLLLLFYIKVNMSVQETPGNLTQKSSHIDTSKTVS